MSAQSLLNKLSSVFNVRSDKELSVVINTVGAALDTAQGDLSLLRLEYVISTATGSWLDAWGSWFGIPRGLNETDTSYRKRIIAVATRPKNTISALCSAIRTYLGDPNLYIDVYEPYVHVMQYNRSRYDSAHKYQDGVYMRFGVVDLRMPIQITAELREIVEQVKGAGIKVYLTQITI